MEYAAYLKSLGASDEEIKLLDTPVARKAYEQQQAAVTSANAARDKANQNSATMKEWYDTNIGEYNKMEQRVIATSANEARFRTALRTAVDQGLITLSDDFNLDGEGNTTPPNTTTPPNVDTSKFVTHDLLVQTAEKEGEAIAIAQDIAYEHAQLFPGQRLNFRELRREAVTAKKSVEAFWMEKYGVAAARTEAAKKAQEAHDNKMRAEGAAKERADNAHLYSQNPDLRVPSSSTSPFTVRKDAADLRSKQPWESPSEHTLSDDRVKRALEKNRLREAGQHVQ